MGAARATMDLLAMLGGATLAVSAVVLGASMFPAEDAGPPPQVRGENCTVFPSFCLYTCLAVLGASMFPAEDAGPPPQVKRTGTAVSYISTQNMPSGSAGRLHVSR